MSRSTVRDAVVLHLHKAPVLAGVDLDLERAASLGRELDASVGLEREDGTGGHKHRHLRQRERLLDRLPALEKRRGVPAEEAARGGEHGGRRGGGTEAEALQADA